MKLRCFLDLFCFQSIGARQLSSVELRQGIQLRCRSLVFMFASALFMSSVGQAKSFHNAYIAFDLPDKWNCTLEQTEWVCRAENEKEAKEAIVILTAKEVGPTDSYPAYLEHLKTSQNGSKIIYPPKEMKLNDQNWLDGLHLGSEVGSYYTRYLATIKDRIAVLVTLSAHRDFYTKYSQEFLKIVSSLKIIATKNLLSSPDLGPLHGAQETLGTPVAHFLPSDSVQIENGAGQKSDGGLSKTKKLLGFLILLIVVVGAYLFYKTRKSS